MYRNKMMIIFTCLVGFLLIFMIWSSNIVAENDAKRRQEVSKEPQNVIGVEIPEEQRSDFISEEIEEEPDEDVDFEDEEIESSDTDVVADGRRIVIDTSEIMPEITQNTNTGISVPRNYLDKLDFSSGLILWNLSTLPLKVYIEDESGLPDKFADGVKGAFNNWQRASGNFVTFEFVYEPDAAQIFVTAPETSGASCPGENGNGMDNKLEIKNGKLVSARLTVPQQDCNGEDVNAANLYAPLQHQIGHILGIKGHSDRNADVMYPESSYENVNLTDIDISTLKLLYKFRPTVTNAYFTKDQMSKLLKASLIKGKSADEIRAILTKELNKSDAAKSRFDILTEEAFNYYQNENYNMAENKYHEALGATSDNLEKVYVSRCLAIIYLNKNEYKDAARYANNVVDMSNTPLNQYLVAYINFVNGNEDAALFRLEDIIKKYPKLKAAYPLAAQIYKKRGDTQKLDALVEQAKQNFYDRSPVYIQE